MRASHKISLIDAIATALDERYEESDIDIFLNHFGIKTPDASFNFSSKRNYAKNHLRNLSSGILLNMGADLEITTTAQLAGAIPPQNWPDDSKFRLFISHVSAEKVKASRLRDCLKAFRVDGFVAHQDIVPTAKWQQEIERALSVMDAFVAIHTKGFSASSWTQQEIGFAVARGVKIISLKMEEDPTGFISQHQALPRQGRKAEDIAAEIATILLADELTRDRMESVRKAAKRTLPSDTDPDEIPF